MRPAKLERPEYPTVHKWYCSRRWSLLRIEVLRAQPFCVVCRAQGRRVLSQDVDHIVKHGGDPTVFWDRENLQGLCRPCHTRKTTRGE